MVFRYLLVAIGVLCAATGSPAGGGVGSSNPIHNQCEYSSGDGICFGHELRRKKFLMADGFTNLNHGSFGTVPAPVADQQYSYFLEQEAYPDTWFRVNYFTYIDESRSALAKYVNASVEDLVLVENASSAMNSILRSIALSRGDKVMLLSTAYGMVTETLDWLVSTAGIELVIVNVEFPLVDEEQILGGVRAALTANPDIKVSIFSHISSMPSLIEPVKEMTALVRELSSSLVVVDGAHAPGQLDIDLNALQVDFYLGNCHKWLYAPKGTAFLWTTRRQQQSDESSQRSPEPTVISSSGKHDYIGRYAYTGTRDYTHFTTVPAALAFRDYLGGDAAIMGYCRRLAADAAEMLVSQWGTSMLVPLDMVSFLFSVILPSTDADAIAYVQSTMDSEYLIYFVYDKTVSAKTGETIFFTRLSAQVYLELSDFERFGALLPKLLLEYSAKHAHV
jgi:selenocysteine lyase/cysteine desulfurase